MDPSTVASATTLLVALGLGKYAAGILSLAVLAGFVGAHVMPWLPVASPTSSVTYRVFYGALRMVTGNYLNNAPTAVPAAPAPAPAPVAAPAAKPWPDKSTAS